MTVIMQSEVKVTIIAHTLMLSKSSDLTCIDCVQLEGILYLITAR